ARRDPREHSHRSPGSDEWPTGRIAKMTEQPLDVPIEHLLRELTPHVLGIVVRRFRDFAAAEDAVQEASLAAAIQWPSEGKPENPRARLAPGAFPPQRAH